MVGLISVSSDVSCSISHAASEDSHEYISALSLWNYGQAIAGYMLYPRLPPVIRSRTYAERYGVLYVSLCPNPSPHHAQAI